MPRLLYKYLKIGHLFCILKNCKRVVACILPWSRIQICKLQYCRPTLTTTVYVITACDYTRPPTAKHPKVRGEATGMLVGAKHPPKSPIRTPTQILASTPKHYKKTISLGKNVFCCQSNHKFSNYGLIKPLADAYHLDDDGMLKSQVAFCLMSLQGDGIAQPTDNSSLLQFLAPAFFPTLRKVLQPAFTATISNVSAERSFSCMRRIHTYVRSQKSD